MIICFKDFCKDGKNISWLRAAPGTRLCVELHYDQKVYVGSLGTIMARKLVNDPSFQYIATFLAVLRCTLSKSGF